MSQNLIHALLLPLPPLLGFWIFRLKGRVGLSYGYFLGGILAVLSLPWPEIAGYKLPSAYMGGALFGFSLFLQAHREGRQGLRRLGFGVGGATTFAAVLGLQMGLSLHYFVVFWAGSILNALLWLLFFDLGYRLTRGRYLQLRMPLTGGAALLIASLVHHLLPFGTTAMTWWASLVSGLLLGFVALGQLVWLRDQGVWVEGRGDGFRLALSMLEKAKVPEGPSLAYGIEARQPILLLNDKGAVLESNGPFGRLVGLPRQQLRGYSLISLFQGQDSSVWEDLRQQLQRQGQGSTAATLVHQDGSFQDVNLEATAFDRNMALVWVADHSEGSLGLRGGGAPGLLAEHPDLAATRRELVNAVGAIQPAAEQILQETREEGTRKAAELILLAAARLNPEATASPSLPLLDAAETLQELGPTLKRMMPAGIRVDLRGAPLPLRIPREALQRILSHLALHGRQALRRGSVILTVEPQRLGGRLWALVSLELEGEPAGAVENLLGLRWLQEQVGEARGMLELNQEPGGSIWPSIYLPVEEAEGPQAQASPLLARRVWVVAQDPLVLEAMSSLTPRAGRDALRLPPPPGLLPDPVRPESADLLVLERTDQLGRFQKRMRSFQRDAIPTLVVADAQGSPVPPLGLGLTRVGFLQKPFTAQEFVQSLLALLRVGTR